MSGAWEDERSSPRMAGAGRYELRDVIGGGRTGLVYRAYDRELGRIVALKTLRAVDADGLYRLKREFRTLARLAHPNLVPFFDLFVQDDERFFTMELIDGRDFVESFRARLRDDQPAENAFRDLRAAVVQLAAGLDALHRHGLLHRDVKPANVLLDKSGRLVLMDFGLAIEVTPRDGEVAVVAGTIGYLAPEQIAGGIVTPASDWYAAGAMLYEALTGRLPFEGRALLDLLSGRAAVPAAPRQVEPRTPADLDRLTMALLELEPQRRPLALEVVDRLEPHPVALRSPPPEPSPLMPHVPFVGRGGELDELHAALRASRTASLVLEVRGPSGIGKTALLSEFAARARRSEGALVLGARCHPQEAIPFKAVDGAIDEMARHLAGLPDDALARLLPPEIAAARRMFPVLGRVERIARAIDSGALDLDPIHGRQRAFAALREVLARLATERPLVLWIDDVQWGDLDSVALLRELLRAPGAPLILLLLSLPSATEAPSPVLEALRAAEADAGERTPVRVLALAPLTRADAEVLAAAVLETALPGEADQARRIAEESRGSPLFAAELARHLVARRASNDVVSETEFPGIGEVLAARIAALPEIAREVLELVAVAGRPLARELDNHARHKDVDLRPALALLRSQCLVGALPLADRVATATYHDRIREAVLAMLPESRQQALHRRLAGALEEEGNADPRLLVEHYEKGGERLRAGELALDAANRAADELAFNQAAELYVRALDLGATTLPRWRLEARTGTMLTYAGRGSEGAVRFEAAASTLHALSPGDTRQIALRRRAAELYLRSGLYREGLETLRRTLDEAGVRYPRTQTTALTSILVHRVKLRLRALLPRTGAASDVDRERLETYWSAGVGLSLFDMIRAADFQLRHALLAYRVDDPRHRARALATEAMTLAWEGGARKRRRSALIQADATRFAASVGDPRIAIQTLVARAALAFVERRFGEALELCEEGTRVSREHNVGTTWEIANLDLCALSALACAGEMTLLRERLRALQRQAQQRGDLYSAISLRLGFPNLGWLAGDDPEEARRQIASARAAATLAPFQEYCAVFAAAQVDLYDGDPLAGWRRTSDAWPMFRRSYLLRVQGVRVDLRELRARCALATVDAKLATARESARLLRFVDRAARRLAREQAPWTTAPVTALRSGIAWQRGEHAAALAALGDAQSGFAALGMRMHAASAGFHLARAGAGDTAAGCDATMRALGAVNPARLAATLVPGFTTETRLR